MSFTVDSEYRDSEKKPESEEYQVYKHAEGNMVALHTHQTWPGNEEYVTMDFFRFDANGKIIEHWNTIQKVPDETKNSNPMY